MYTQCRCSASGFRWVVDSIDSDEERAALFTSAKGMTALKTDDLKALLRLVHRGELTCPITQIGLAQSGLLRLGDDVGHLFGLNEAGVRAVLVAVLAERNQRNKQ